MIALGSDHAGDELKRHIMQHFDELGIEYKDLGFYELKRDDDYPVVAKKVARAVQSGASDTPYAALIPKKSSASLSS